jgi:AAA15 family ATPase/GTPase
MTLTKTLEEIEQIIQQYKEKALSLVESRREQNPSLKPIGSNCYTIRLSELSEDLVLSPQYYDFLWQYDALLKKLREQSLESFKKTIETVIQTGKLNGQRFHPDVIAVLKGLL